MKIEWYLTIGITLMIPLLILELKPYFWYCLIVALVGLFIIFWGINKCESDNE